MRLRFYFLRKKKLFLLSSARSPGKSLSKEIPFTMSTINASSAYCLVLIFLFLFLSFVLSLLRSRLLFFVCLFIYFFIFDCNSTLLRWRCFCCCCCCTHIVFEPYCCWEFALAAPINRHTHIRIILSDFVHPFLLIFVCDFYILF